MKYCKHCGNQIEENAEICPFCHGVVSANKNSTAKSSNNEKKSAGVSIGLIILSVIFPLIGIILGFTKMGKDTEAAKKYLIVSLVSICAAYLINVLSFMR